MCFFVVQWNFKLKIKLNNLNQKHKDRIACTREYVRSESRFEGSARVDEEGGNSKEKCYRMFYNS